MRISYHKETDSLYIHLNNRPTAESEEVAPDTVLHFDDSGGITGLEIYAGASEKVDFSGMEVTGLDANEGNEGNGVSKDDGRVNLTPGDHRGNMHVLFRALGASHKTDPSRLSSEVSKTVTDEDTKNYRKVWGESRREG